jgi:ATP-binding cassette subfamily F protein 3
LLISHDRFFLDKLVSRVFELKGGQLKQYEGNYTDYLRYKKAHHTESESKNTEHEIIKSSVKNSKGRKKREAELRQSISGQRKELEQKITQHETEIELFEKEKAEIENKLANPEIFKDENKARIINQRYQEIQKRLPELYENWEKSQEDLEKLLESINN